MFSVTLRGPCCIGGSVRWLPGVQCSPEGLFGVQGSILGRVPLKQKHKLSYSCLALPLRLGPRALFVQAAGVNAFPEHNSDTGRYSFLLKSTCSEAGLWVQVPALPLVSCDLEKPLLFSEPQAWGVVRVVMEPLNSVWSPAEAIQVLTATDVIIIVIMLR